MTPPQCQMCPNPAKRRQRLFNKFDKTCGPECARKLKQDRSTAFMRGFVVTRTDRQAGGKG